MFETNLINFILFTTNQYLQNCLKISLTYQKILMLDYLSDMKSSISKKILNNYKGEILYASTKLILWE